MIPMWLLADTRINGYPTALKFAVIVVTHADEKMTLSDLHVLKILLFHIELWEILHGRC